MPTFSVIIPTYNSEKFIKNTIASVLHQIFPDFELIIIDDGSTDTTQTILQELAMTDSRIKIVTTPNSGGPTVPTNIGINLAQGKYLAFLDHDDIWHHNKLQILFEHFTKNPHVGFIGSNVEIYDEVHNTKTTTKALTHNVTLDPHTILAGNYFNTFSMMSVKKEVFNDIGLLDTNLLVFADYELVIRLLSKDIPHLFIDEPLVMYRVHHYNASALSRSGQRRAHDLERIITKHSELFNNNKKSLARVYGAIARIYLYLGNKKKALLFLQQALYVDPYNPILYIKFFFILLGNDSYSYFSQLKNKVGRKVS